MSFYTSLTGLNSATAQLAVTANNIANVGTSGFKRSRANFGDIFSTSPLQKSSSQIGQGVALKQVSQEFSQGNVSTSGNSLDLAITGDGFFPLKSPDGLQNIYTRNGSFTLNDQNNVVNSTGQRLMAASVDSSGKADLENLAALTIPPKTSGQAKETTKIQLGLNLPADSAVITADFDRTNPATYNKSTALTVYDSGGNGYLATVYYVKTQNASQGQAVPQSKWQTYFYVGDTLVKPALLQAQDSFGSSLYINKYGDILPKSDPKVIPSSGTVEMFSLNDQTTKVPSTSANVSGKAYVAQDLKDAATDHGATGSGSINLEIKVGSSTYNLTYNLGAADRYPEALAKNVESAINKKMESRGDTSRVAMKWNATSTPPAFEIVNKTGVVEVKSYTGTNPIVYGTFLTDLKSIQSSAFNFQLAGTLSFNINVDEMGSSFPISYGLTTADKDPTVLAKNLEIFINNQLGNSSNPDPRYGIKVTFAADSNTFKFSSGTTGDNSSIVVSGANDLSQAVLGLPNPTDLDLTKRELRVDPKLDDAVRGKSSLPAVLTGEAITSNTSGSVTVGSTNKDFFVTYGNISGSVEVPPTTYTSMDKMALALQDAINSLVDTTTGRKVSGVTVSWSATAKKFTFSTGETGANVSFQISGSNDWGLGNTEIARGSNSEWINVKNNQFKQNGVPQYVKNGTQTEDISDLSTKTQWWPVYLSRGELSFGLSGKTLSPLTKMPFETAFLAGGKGALTMSIDFTQSTQYSSAFAVLSQSQDGAPEGQLMGLDIGVDGLVSATYSNGSQVSLGKIVLANFSSPTGLRQTGDASYLASATSGKAKIGEAGSAGFGSIRAGATERSNVDLTQELVDLITAQRNFQANAKAIETSSTMTQAIVNIRA
ncbi:MAG: Flagellar hook protein FlgE [Pseudomonadota bacterium]|jgi:flagellar hook-basal body protein